MVAALNEQPRDVALRFFDESPEPVLDSVEPVLVLTRENLAQVIGYVGPKGALRLQIIMIDPADCESLRAMPANCENDCRLGGLVTGSSAFMAPC